MVVGKFELLSVVPINYGLLIAHIHINYPLTHFFNSYRRLIALIEHYQEVFQDMYYLQITL